MNDNWVGDIGDYGKYGLLRALNNGGGFRFGIVWMKTKTTEGRSRRTYEYLDTSVKENKSLEACDPELYRILKSLEDVGRRTIIELEASHALPADTGYFHDLLDFGRMPAVGRRKARNDRRLFRKEWFGRVRDALLGTSVVFFDPDNGLEVKSKKRHLSAGPKYVWYGELEPFFHGKSLIVYPHGNRDRAGAEEAIKRRAHDLRGALKCDRVWAVRWHRVQPRVYFVIPAAEHIARMNQAIRRLKVSQWCRGAISR